MSFSIDDDKILEKYKAFAWTKIEGLHNVELNALRIYHDRYVKKKIKTYVHKFILISVV